MKIKRLIISKYKNVEGLNLKFKSSLISLLVGRNGLGKSNLIEILALIFRDLERNESELDFTEWAYRENHFEYYINYECRNSEMRILCRKGVFRIFRREKKTKQKYIELSISEFKASRGEEFLPKYIVGYYSGENKRIKEIIQPYEDKVIDQLKKNVGLESGLRRIFFAQNYHSQMVLVTLLLYKNQSRNEKFKKKVDILIKKYCTFESAQQLDVELKQPAYYRRPQKPTPKSPLPIESIELLEDNLLNNIAFPFWGLKGKADVIITFLYNNAVKRNNFYDSENRNKEEKLILEEIDSNAAGAGINDTFGSPADFFDALESLLLTQTLERLSLTVKSKMEKVSFSFNELSEGEQQLITILGLVLMVGNEDCLFLLDEPDTHLNPIWQREYVKLLTDFNLDDKNSHMIVATHSPLIVQAAQKADIFLYTQKKGKIEVHENYMNIHNWRIDQVLVSEYFNLKSSRPPKLDPFFSKRNKILSKKHLTRADKKKLEKLEEQYGGMPSGESLIEFKIMDFLKQATAEHQEDDQNN